VCERTSKTTRGEKEGRKFQQKKDECFKATRDIYIKPIALRPPPTFEELSLYKEERVIKRHFFKSFMLSSNI